MSKIEYETCITSQRVKLSDRVLTLIAAFIVSKSLERVQRRIDAARLRAEQKRAQRALNARNEQISESCDKTYNVVRVEDCV